MTEISRRSAVAAMGMLAATGAGTVIAAPQSTGSPTGPAWAGNHQPKPLTFNPALLDGLSERLITSHWENNYVGSVKALNMVELRLAAALADKDLPPVIYGDLKREELHRTGSVVLHELYFGALAGDGRPGDAILDVLKAGFGSFEAWQSEFKRTAMSLAGGSGWCVLTYNQHTQSLHNYWAWDHMHAAVTGMPLLALDMYEHAYHMDYGAAAAKYVDAFLRNISWDEVDRRYRRAVRTTAA